MDKEKLAYIGYCISTNITKLLQYLLDGIGYSFLPKSIVKSHIDNHSLIFIPLIDFEAPLISSYFIYRTNNHQVQKILSLFPFNKSLG